MLAKGNNSYKTQLGQWFQAYREKNNKMKTQFKLSLDILNQITSSAHVSPDALGGSIMGAWRSGLDKELIDMYENIRHSYGPSLIQELQEMIALIDKENEDLAKYFNSTINEDIVALKQFESLCITYNRDKRDLIQRIYTKIPGLAHIGERVHGIHNQLVEVNASHYRESALIFIPYYINFAEQILDENSKPNDVFVNLARCLNYLSGYFRESDLGIIEDFAQGLIDAINDPSISATPSQLKALKLTGRTAGADFKSQLSCFLKNYFLKGVGKETAPVLNELLSELEWSQNGPKKSYESVNGEDKKLDKYLKDVVKRLFNCPLKFKLDKKSESKNWYRENIEKIVKLPSNLKDLKDEFEKTWVTILRSAIIKGGYKFVGSKSEDDLEFNNISGGDMNLKDFKKALKDGKEEKKDQIEAIMDIFRIILQGNNPHNNKEFKSFIENQKSSIIIKSGKTNPGSLGRDSAFEDLDKNDKTEVLKNVSKKTKMYSDFISHAEHIKEDSYETEIIKLIDATNYFLSPESVLEKDEAKSYLISIIKYKRGTATEEEIDNFYISLISLKAQLERLKKSFTEENIISIFHNVTAVYNFLESNNLS